MLHSSPFITLAPDQLHHNLGHHLPQPNLFMSCLTFSPNDSRDGDRVSESYHPWLSEHGEVLLGD